MKIRHKYLEEIGIKDDELISNNRFKSWLRRRRLEREYRRVGVNPMDCWGLDSTFYKWMYEHICKYIDDASKVVDLEYSKFTYEGEELTQMDILVRIKELLKKIICMDVMLDSNKYKIKRELTKKVLDMWYIVLDHMWW